MKRAIQIAKELNIGVYTVFEYLKQLGYDVKSPNTKINEEVAKKVVLLNNGTLVKELKEEKIPNTIVKEIPEFIVEDNPFQTEFDKSIINTDNFANRKIEKRKIEDVEFDTIFSDFEAFALCAGLEDNHAKFIARKFFKTTISPSEEIVEAHFLAMQALNKYGSTLLSFVLQLPPLPFKAFNATQIFSALDKRRMLQDYPKLRITFQNENNETEKIQISYYTVNENQGRVTNENYLMIKNKTTGKDLMKISRSGYIVVQKNAKQIVPILQLFVRFYKNTKNTILNYGLETGECSICGRELTDSKSIRRGVGPVCSSYL